MKDKILTTFATIAIVMCLVSLVLIVISFSIMKYKHNFIANSINAKYPTICSKCGLGLDMYSTKTISAYSPKIPSCEYPTQPWAINQYITNN